MNDIRTFAPVEKRDEDVEVEEESAGNVDLCEKWSVRVTAVF